MDENTEILRQILTLLQNYSSSTGASAGSTSNNNDPAGDALKDVAEKASDLKADFRKLTDSIKETNKNTFGFSDRLKRSMSPLGDSKDAIDSLNEQLEEFQETLNETDAESAKQIKNELTREIQRAQAAAVYNTSMQGLTTNLRSLGTNVIQFGSQLRQLQNGQEGDEIQQAGELMKLASNMLFDGISAVSNSIGAFAGKIPGASMAIGGFAKALGNLSQATKAIVNTALDVLTKELQRTVTGFRDLSSSGVLFADGMTGMRAAAGASGLTIEQFSNVVKANTQSLAATGLGMSEASKRIGLAFSTAPQLRGQLMNLGYSFEEQGGLVAEVLGDMASRAGPLQASDAQIAQQTAQYAENLRVISSITGEDARKKMQESRDAANNLAFNQKLAGMDATQRQNTIAAMANMSDLQKKSFMEMVTFGSVINKEGAMMMGSSSGFAGSMNEFLTKFQSGALTAQTALDTQGKYGDQIRKDVLSNTAIAAVGLAGISGPAGNLATEMNKMLGHVQKYNQEAINRAKTAAEGQGKTEDPLTTETNAVIENMQKMKVAVNELITDSGALTGLSKGAELMTQGLIQGAEELKKIIDSIEKGEIPGTDGTKIDKVGDALTGAATGAAAGAIAGSFIPVIGTAVGAALGGLTGAAIGWFDSQKGNATGGIVSGPKDGYAVKVHGTELILPLTESNKIKKDTEGLDLLKNMLKDDMSVISDSKNKSTNLSVPVTDFTNKINDSSSATIANKLTRNIPFEDKSKMQDLSGVADQLTDSFATSSRLQLNDISAITNQLTNEYSKNAKSKLVDENATDMRTPQPSIMNFSELVQKIESLEKVFNIQISKSSVTNDLLSEQSDYLRNILRASQ